MIAPRWRKVLADLWGNKVRSILLILTIGVGVFAVGFITAVGDYSMSDMDADFQASNGHSGILSSDPFTDDLLSALRHTPGVSFVEGRVAITGRAVIAEDNLFPIQVSSIPDVSALEIDRLSPVDSQPLPPLQHHEIYLADSALGVIKAQPGQTLTIELTDGRRRQLLVAAVAHDVNAIPAAFGSAIIAYCDVDTLEWLGGTQDYNQVFFTVQEQKTDKAHVTAVAQLLTDKIEASGRKVYSTFIYNPGRHFAKDIFQAVTTVLAILGAMSVFLSTFLIINIISALLNQHIRFIGIMKAIGGRQSQIMVMYLALVLCFGIIALALVCWPASLAAYAVEKGMGAMLNFWVRPFRYSLGAVVLQGSIALFVPILAAIVPILNGTRLTVRKAISSYGLGKGHFGQSALDRLLNRIRFLSRPTLISLRNTFRRKTRLVLTLSTLTLAGAIFIAVFNLWTAFDLVLEQIKGYYLADVNVQLAHNYRLEQLENLLSNTPGISHIEGWSLQLGELLAPDRSRSIQIAFVAPPGNSQLIQPIVTAGRWLNVEDKNAIVIGNQVLKEFPFLHVGDTVITKINEQEYSWKIVGQFKMAGNSNPALVYTNYNYLTRLLDQTGQVGNLRVITTSPDPLTQGVVAQRLEGIFQRNNIQVSQVTTGETWRQQQAGQLNVMVYFLLVMALLIAVVGGLGLMGTMSMNVMERSREIGVLRAVGASNLAVLRLVLVEGLLIGGLSWGLGIIVSIPITYVLNAGVGASILSAPLDFTFGLNGILIWLGIIAIIAGLASALPAWNAMRLTVREVLSYE